MFKFKISTATITSIVLGFLCFALLLNDADARLGACGDRLLPSNKVRKLRSVWLECAPSVDHFVRRPQPFNFKAWQRSKDLLEQQQLVQDSQELIQWGGSVPYQTIEKWIWVDWVYGPDPSCGYDRVCTTDSEGRESCTSVMRSCYHDETQYEARHCSTLQMDYTAEFVRPARTQEEAIEKGWTRGNLERYGVDLDQDYFWNPTAGETLEGKHRKYYPTIPNKYDLLPGEVEDVQFFTNAKSDTSIRPVAEVGDAWNDYEFQISWDRRECHFARGFTADLKIFTRGRKIKKTPNAFAIPERRESQWLRRTLEDASNGEEVPYRPVHLELEDTSDAIISSMARQSRKMEKRIAEVKSELGIEGNVTSEESARFIEENSGEGYGFSQDTQVKIRLIEEKPFWLIDRRVGQYMRVSGEDVEYKGGWNIDLNDTHPDRNLYTAAGPDIFGLLDPLYDKMRVELTPGTDYTIRVSMFQKNVPFYEQKEGFISGENAIYSKELHIPFSTPRDADGRGTGQKILDCWMANWTEVGKKCF